MVELQKATHTETTIKQAMLMLTKPIQSHHQTVMSAKLTTEAVPEVEPRRQKVKSILQVA